MQKHFVEETAPDGRHWTERFAGAGRGTECLREIHACQRGALGERLVTPGDYSCSVEHRSAETVLLHDLTNRSGAIVMASSVSTVDNPTESQLVLEQKGNEWFVRSLVLSGTGEVLYFNPPATRTETGQLARLGPRKTSTVSNP